ncbi:MAG: serine/threonine-protein kinase [Phycisphaerales bacterium]
MTSADRVPRDEAAADRHADKPAPRQPDVAETLRRSFQERLEAVFVEACDLAPEACDAFLQRACADDEALRAAVAEMLHEAREPDPILAQPPFGAALRALAELRSSAVVRAGGPPAPPDVEAPGATFGEFELIERLGEGGFATVYRARQRGSVRRDVALKIPRPGLDASLMARFLAERQALAGMNEEHLAQFLEAGETPTGRPFFTMELVEGEPITDFCDRHALSIGDRLELFLQVCEAIQHAHQKGVIHRDLKPANVLATMRGEQPFAKVIDFGIARPTDDARAAGGAHAATTLGQFLGTPGYMSPEQVRTASDVDTRSDVYALGILLYELLTGRTPLAWAGLQGASLAEVQRFTCEVDPGRPSMRLRAAGPALAALAASRAAAPTRLVASIRGDLDRIVLKAIETDPRRRYATVAELGADVRRFLRAEPILAQPPTARYVLGKFVRRHRGAVIAASAIALSLVAGLVVATVGLVKAERRARETKEVADFQGEILRDIDIGTQGVGLREDLLGQYRDALRIKGVPPEEVDVRVEVLRRELEDVNATDTAAAVIDRSILAPAAASIDRKFAAQPLVAASLRQTVADAYRKLGNFDAAWPLQQQALDDVAEAVFTPTPPATLDSVHRRAALRVEPPRAEVTFGEAFAAACRVFASAESRQSRSAHVCTRQDASMPAGRWSPRRRA